jgi:hypothetical protein
LEFEEALDIARQLKDSVEEKKAARGLGKSLLLVEIPTSP